MAYRRQPAIWIILAAPTSYLHRFAANDLLASLPGVALECTLPHFTLVQLAIGETLYEAGVPQSHVYFP
jgi:hypothetical protein